MLKNKGKVYLIGGGLGPISYLTVRAYELLLQAEILIYDALISPELLKLVPLDCLKINVGKRGGGSQTPQSKINQLLCAYCLDGKQVVRLKSGNPFIFGRATLEIEALTEANCNFEIVPGISSALAAPTLATIPLTDSLLSSSFVVLSGHDPESLDWEALARIDTLVILMAGRTLEVIINNLLLFGRSRDESIAIIKDGGRSSQQIWQGNLSNILGKIQGISLSPSVIVIGKVVELGNKLNNSKTLPLNGKKIIVTRAAESTNKFGNLLQKQGAITIDMPALEITPPSSWQELDDAIAKLNEFDWLILTSANGVNYFFQRLEVLGKDARALAGIKISVVGKKTAISLKEKGLQPDFIPPDFVADSLVENFPESIKGKKFLFPRVETGGREVLVKELNAAGGIVTEVAAYQSRCPQNIPSEAWLAIQQHQIDIVTFASSKTVQNFYYLLESALKDYPDITLESLLDGVYFASIGPSTTKTCEQIFGRVDMEAQQYTLEGLTETIIQWVGNN